MEEVVTHISRCTHCSAKNFILQIWSEYCLIGSCANLNLSCVLFHLVSPCMPLVNCKLQIFSFQLVGSSCPYKVTCAHISYVLFGININLAFGEPRFQSGLFCLQFPGGGQKLTWEGWHTSFCRSKIRSILPRSILIPTKFYLFTKMKKTSWKNISPPQYLWSIIT